MNLRSCFWVAQRKFGGPTFIDCQLVVSQEARRWSELVKSWRSFVLGGARMWAGAGDDSPQASGERMARAVKGWGRKRCQYGNDHIHGSQFRGRLATLTNTVRHQNKLACFTGIAQKQRDCLLKDIDSDPGTLKLRSLCLITRRSSLKNSVI